MTASTTFEHDRTAATRPTADDRAVGLWLLTVAAMIFIMAVVGAITRLTESGLSIMEWAPFSGTLPPMSEAEWERLFTLYKTIPEYQELNRGMTMAEFREIFWWEWIHRLWGRLIGVVFLIPFIWFLARGRLRPGLTPRLAGLFVLGGLQGAIGWFMVASGFAERTDVSQYRLALHLGLAVLLYALVLALAFGLLRPAPDGGPDAARTRRGVNALLALIAVTLISGAFVAGINAGLIYNTFPLMGGQVVPPDYGFFEPWIVNWFENVAAVQFNHRLLAVGTVAATIALWVWSQRHALTPAARNSLHALAAMSLIQLGLGIVTLLALVPVWLGALHQAGALVLLALALWAHHLLRTPEEPATAG